MNKIFCTRCGKKEAYSVDTGRLFDVMDMDMGDAYDIEVVEMKCSDSECKQSFYINISDLEEMQNA